MTEPLTVVRAFLQHLNADETDQAVALLAPEVVWRNTGLPTVRGEKVADALQMLTDAASGSASSCTTPPPTARPCSPTATTP